MVKLKLNCGMPLGHERAIDATRIIGQKAQFNEPYYKVLKPYNSSEVGPLDNYQSFKNIVFIGVGGSLLAIKTLLAATPANSNKRIYFCADESQCQQLPSQINKENTLFYIISQSGNTTETIMMAEYCLQLNHAAAQFLFNIGGNSSYLQNLAIKAKATIQLYPDDINPRYSIITGNMMLPMKLAGINYGRFFAGINRFWQEYTRPTTSEYLDFINHSYALSQGKQLVNIALDARFEPIINWHHRIAAEGLASLDNYQASLDILNSNDAHTLLELALARPANKLFRIYQMQDAANSLASQYQAIIRGVVQEKGADYQQVIVPDDTIENTGYLLASLIASDLTIAQMVGASAFSQPNIDYIKQRALGSSLNFG